MKHLIVIIILILICSTLIGNPVPIGGPGKTPMPYDSIQHEKHIALIKEKVVIDERTKKREIHPQFRKSISPEVAKEEGWSKYYDKPVITYTGYYFLKNTSNKKQTIKIGFPMVSATAKYNAMDLGEILNFEAYANNKSLTVKFIESGNSSIFLYKGFKEYPLFKYLIKYNFAKKVEGEYDYIDLSYLRENKSNIKKMIYSIKELNRKQKKELLEAVNYNLFANREGDWDYYASLDWAIFTIDFKPQEIVKLKLKYQSPETSDIDYILETGSYWKDKIGTCEVIIYFKENIYNYDIKIKEYKKINSKTIKYLFKNFEPKINILIRRK